MKRLPRALADRFVERYVLLPRRVEADLLALHIVSAIDVSIACLRDPNAPRIRRESVLHLNGEADGAACERDVQTMPIPNHQFFVAHDLYCPRYLSITTFR